MNFKICTSCKTILDDLGIQMSAGLKGKNSERYLTARKTAIPFVCEGCALIARHQKETTPPDPSTYEKLGSRS